MKKMITIFIILILMLNLAEPGYCDGPLKKLGRGTWNLITCPFEIGNRIDRDWKSMGPWHGLTYGFIEGVCMVVFRATMGFYEVVSFPIPLPDGYNPVLKDPEFFFLK